MRGKFHDQRSLAGYRPWGCKRIRHDLVTKFQQNHGRINAKKKHWNVVSIVLFPENHNAGDSDFEFERR